MATIQIADNDARVQYTQAVTANSTTLTIDFPFFDLDDIKVIVTTSAGVDTTLTRGTGTGTFAVNGTAVDDGFSGGNVTLGDSYDDTHTYTIFRDITIQRTTDFPTSGPFNIASLNTELDKLTAITQQNNNNFERSVKLTDSDATANLTIPNATTRPNKYLGFDGAGNLTALSGTGAEIGTIQTANLADALITTAKLADTSVTSAKIATNAVTNAKMADDSVGSDEIIDNSVTASELNVTGNGTSGQALLSDGDGSMSWGSVNVYPQAITVLTTGTSYTIPSNARAILIKASGGGGGGAVHANPAIGGLATNSFTQGDPGDATTVTNTTLGISINAPGGSRGSVGGSMTTSQWHTNQGTASGGDVFWNHGASGGRTTGNNFDNSQEDGAKGCLVQKYVTGSNVGGEVLTYSLGAGGNSTNSGGSRQPEDGQNGYLELWIW